MNKILDNLIEESNVFPEEVCEEIEKKFRENNNWKLKDQERKEHYSHVFKNDSKYLPEEHEFYLARFWENEELANDDLIKSSVNNYVKDKIIKIYNKKISKIDIRPHKFKIGDYFRVHFDAYAGSIAVNISLNKNWKWDWGGILCVAHGENNKNLVGLIPKWNTMNILDNFIDRSPHFVTPIQNFAKDERLTMTFFVTFD